MCRIMAEQTVSESTAVFIANCWTVGWSIPVMDLLTATCLTHLSMLYMKAAASCFAVLCWPKVLAMGQAVLEITTDGCEEIINSSRASDKA